MSSPVRLVPRGERAAPRTFREGANPPYAIRWYGATSLWGHFRNFVSTAIASESVDSRDWMRPLSAEEMLAGAARVFGVEAKATLLESLDRPLWIDWVADTGDDRDVSKAVGRMVFSSYVLAGDDTGGDELSLPRGDVLLFGGDTAYPVATADEIQRRVVQPWNEALRELRDAGAPEGPPRLLLGIPGNHDWYDGLDGFGRFFRRPAHDLDSLGQSLRPESLPSPEQARGVGLLARGLHLDEVGGWVDTIAGAARMTRAFWAGTAVSRRRRLVLDGYEPIQESSYWALPLAPGLEMWGVDRQLGRLDYRQRGYFQLRRDTVGRTATWLVAPDPAIAFGEPWQFGERILDGAGLSLERDRVLYQCGDMHQYERRDLGRSMHVIAGGGGAFLHGTRIVADPRPAAVAYPDGKTTRRLALSVPLKLMIGRAGYLVHIAAGLVAALELAIGWHAPLRFAVTSLVLTLLFVWALYSIAGHHRAFPRRVLALTIPFGAALGLLPMVLSIALRRLGHVLPLLGRDAVVVVVYAFAAALLFGTFLSICAVLGLELQQVFTVLGHPGFKHFVRMRVSPDGTVDAWVIGKDDPLAPEPPLLVDRFTFTPRAERPRR